MLWGKWQRVAALASAIVGLQEAAWAQDHGYISAPLLSPHAAHSLDQAILVIGIPPLMIFAGIFFYFYRRQRSKPRSS